MTLKQKIAQFEDLFSENARAIEGCISAGDTSPRVFELLKQIICLTNNSVDLLPTYTFVQRQEDIKQLKTKVESIKRARIKKFSFTKCLSVGTPAEKRDTPLVVPSVQSFGFASRANEVLELSEDQTEKRHVTLSDLVNCTVHLRGEMRGLHVGSLTGSRVHSGPVRSSVFVENCRDCEIHVECQQLRISRSVDCRFVVVVGNRAVLEGSRGIGFKGVGLDRVDDFDWLNQHQQSPNFYFLE